MKKIKKRYILTIAIILGVIGFFFYGWYYQNLPEFAMPAISQISSPSATDRILVLAPHPDDETLGAGGYIHQAIQNQATVKVVIVTNGDGERFSASKSFRKVMVKPKDYIQTGNSRQQESTNALKTLGLNEENIIFLGFPDGGLKSLLTKNWTNPYKSNYTKVSVSPYTNSYFPDVSYTGQNLTANLTSIINDFKPTIILTTSSIDLHPDHAALAQFAKNATAGKNIKINYYLIHYRHFPYPKGLVLARNLTPPLRLFLQNQTWQQFELDNQTEQLKLAAINQYQSQLKEPFLKSLMQGFVKKNELFVSI